MPGFRYSYRSQPDVTLSKANPVSATWYSVLARTQKVWIKSISAKIEWAVTQPTPLQIRIQTDNNTMVYSAANPISTQTYSPTHNTYDDSRSENLQEMKIDYAAADLPVCPIEDVNLSIDCAITWAVTQPTPLFCRVKWAKK